MECRRGGEKQKQKAKDREGKEDRVPGTPRKVFREVVNNKALLGQSALQAC